jgi:transcription elongation factor GreB
MKPPTKKRVKTLNADEAAPEADASVPAKNLMTPTGFGQLKHELRALLYDERPKIVAIVSWAAGNGDRSENGDYIYGKKRLREIDSRVRYITKKLETAEVVEPSKQSHLRQVFFGATVTYARSDNSEHTVTLVGVDEAAINEGKISWLSPVAKALMKAGVGDSVTLRTPMGEEMLEVVSIRYIA